MKNLLFFIIIFISCIINSSEKQITKDIWRKNFYQINNTNWDKYNETVQRWEKLGYNPDITLLDKPNHYNALIQQSGPTLFIHGWGDSQYSHKTYNLCSSNNIPGDVITFNFPDAAYCCKRIRYWMPFTKSSFAGQKDITALICVLKTLHDASCLPAVLYPHSRGSGTTLAVVGILNNPSDTEKEFLTKWNIEELDRINIIKTIKIIYLLNPLTNFDIALNKQIQSQLTLLDYIIPFLIPKLIKPFIKNYFLPFLTQYNPKQKNPIDYVPQWKGMETTILLHFEEFDTSVSNDDDENLTQQLLEIFQENLFVSRTNNGGHNAFEQLINKIIHKFNCDHGCSYYFDKDWGKKPKPYKIIEAAQIKNKNKDNSENIKKHLDDFSKKYTDFNILYYKGTQRLFFILKLSLFIYMLYFAYKIKHSTIII